MADVLVFHHAQGRTPGVLALAAALERGGHTVHVPDLFEGRTFADLASGLRHVERVGFDTIIERGRKVAEGLRTDLVYVGFSLGVLPAQKLAQTRAGARGALLAHACVPLRMFGAPWPKGLPVQIHAMEQDRIFVDEGDLAAARALVAAADRAELFLYPGDRHLFTDRSLPSYDKAAATLFEQRALSFLSTV